MSVTPSPNTMAPEPPKGATAASRAAAASPAAVPSAGERPRTVHAVLLFLIAVAALSPGLGSSPVSLNAEERIVQVTQTMLRTGEYMVPYLDGEPHFTKPPLYYWMSVAAGRVLGRADALVARIPAVLCAGLAVALTYLLGCALRSRAVGLMAGAILLTCMLFTERSHVATFDIALTTAVALAVYGGWRWLEEAGWAGVALLFAGAALGFMIKGPVAWIIVAIALIGALAMRGRLRRLLSWRAGAFILALIAVSSVWYVAVMVRDPLARQVFHDELMLYMGAPAEQHTARHYEPFYQYLLGLPADIAPWSAYLPVVVFCLWRRRALLSRSSALWFPLIWFAGGLAFFSMVPSKQPAYLLPLYPALALVIAWVLLEALGGDEREQAWLRRTNLAVGIACLPAAVALGCLFWARAGAPVALSVMAGAVVGVIGAGVAWLAIKRRNRQALIFLLAGWIVFTPFLYGYYMPAHRYTHEYKDSPQGKAYVERAERFLAFWGLSKMITP